MLAIASQAHARERIGGYVDVGFGGIRTRPFVTAGAVAGTLGLGVSARLRGSARACFEFRATAGEDWPTGVPESATGGHQTLVSFLGGFEFVNSRSLRGLFLTSGLGVGHSTISDARGPTNSPNFGFVPLHDRTGVAYGLGFGYRFSGGPGALQSQLALRTHGLLDEGFSASAYATTITLGFAY
jgi:hypothetical protein